MAVGNSLAAFAEGFAGSRERIKERKERELDRADRGRMMDIMEMQAQNGQAFAGPQHQYGGMGAVPDPASSGGANAARINTGGSAWSAPSGQTADYIRQGFIDRGMPAHIAEGFVWNGHDESGLNSGINEAKPIVAGSRGGFGTWQHTGPRRLALEAYAKSVGKPASDVDVQMDFVMQELQGSEKGAWNAISRTNTPGQAAAAIVNKFLRPAEEHRARRESAYIGADPIKNSMGARPPVRG